MRMSISKTFTFSASHTLAGLADGHPCSRLHGHNYVVTVELSGPLDAAGMVLDYGELSILGQWLDDTFDHRHLNDVLPTNPTAENLAVHILEWLPFEQTVAVTVSETPRTTARAER